MALKIETKVGLFFLIGLVILGIATFKIEDLAQILHRKKTIYATFGHASTLKIGDIVAVSGVKVGEIRAMSVSDEGVRFSLLVDANAPIRKGSVAEVAWGGLLGNRYIDISRAIATAPLLAAGESLETKPSIELAQLVEKLDAAASQFQELAKGDVGNQLGSMLKNLTAISDDIREQRGTVGKLISSVELYTKAMEIADDLKSTSSRLDKIIVGNEDRIKSIIESVYAAAPEARNAFAAISRIGQDIETGKGILPALLKDEKMYGDLKDALARLSTSLDKIDKFAADLREGKGLAARLATDEQLAQDVAEAVASLKNVSERLEKGDGTLARLTRDKDLYEDVKRLVNDARETLRSVKDQVPIGTFTSVLLSAF